MLNGIEVLNEVEMYKDFPTWIILTLGLCFGVGVGLICCFKVKTVVVGAILCLIGFLALSYGLYINSQLSGIVQYQVTISDDVSMVEFNERYDVIKVEGKIWTIVEKEEE